MSIEVIKESGRIYLDYNATTPLASFLEAEIRQWVTVWGNPSSIYHTAREARTLLWKAREQVADFIHCHPLEIVWTSGGSESNNYAIKGLCEKFLNSSRKKIITSSVEHPSVRETLQWAVQRHGFQLEVIPVSQSGQLDVKKYKEVLDERTAFVSIMYVNNETGCIFPIQELVDLSQQAGALFHCDAVQALGKIPVDVQKLGLDLMTLSGHKFYSLKGCGVLYCKKGLALESLIHGGPQERKRRAGTENILSACALGAVAQKGEEILKHNKNITLWRDQLESLIENSIEGIQFIGQNTLRVSHTSLMMIKDVFAETVMMNLDLKGYSVSVSSACHSGSLSPSPVLLGMGYTPEEAQCVLRISFGLGMDFESLKTFSVVLKQIVDRLRNLKEE